MELELLKLFFPEELVAHFDMTGSTIKQGKHGDYLDVEFTERNELPEGDLSSVVMLLFYIFAVGVTKRPEIL